MKYCGYWVSLQGYPETNNKKTVRISIPKEQLFTEKSLKKLMEEASENRERLLGL
ncbi:MAG: DUF4365 domain-containing protein [Hydrococcus sp. RM1_1_31]|nr:DUF4365 domain-containing protein [Hydrococcus sp. RM1_1_31]